jgi:Zn-dependent M28 family amino/carboxypeptidase
MQSFIKDQLDGLGCQIEEDRFTADTPRGPIEMNNIIARFPGHSERAVVISGHYDTKYLPEIHFVGANDAGSSTGLLLEMARVLSERDNGLSVYLVWFDGEEAFGPWSATDGVYGSRHLAQKWHADGTLESIVGLINVDMIGDADLTIMREEHSTRSLQNIIWEAAESLGYKQHFLDGGMPVEDDHVPFLRLGVTAVDLIDFALGPYNRYWHTEHDTMDKLGVESFEVVGEVLVKVLDRLDKRQ